MSRLILVFSSVLIASLSVLAQTPEKPQPRTRSKSVALENQIRQALRLSALSALDSVIEELPQVEDLQGRLLIAEGVVKALAKARPDRCRKVLDSLFDDATQNRKISSPANKDSGPNLDAIIERIVKLATLFDAKLAESYIEKYSSHDDSSGMEDQASSRDAAQAASLRLKMAMDLIDKALPPACRLRRAHWKPAYSPTL